MIQSDTRGQIYGVGYEGPDTQSQIRRGRDFGYLLRLNIFVDQIRGKIKSNAERSGTVENVEDILIR